VRQTPDPRGGWTLLLLAAALILLASIEIGRMLGFRILAKAVEQTPVLPVARYTPRPQESLAPFAVHNWKASTVVRVAPDPHFPEPRVTPSTPAPPPTPKPQPTRRPVAPARRTAPGASPSGAMPTGVGQPDLPPLETPPTPYRDPNAGP